MSILLATLALAPPPPAIFDQSLAAFRARKGFTVQIALDAAMNKAVTAARYRLAYEAPNRVLLKKIVNGQENLVFWFSGTKFLAYDPGAGEMTVREAPRSGPLINRLANCIGGLEDPVAAQLSPATMSAFLSPFKSLQGWRTSYKPNRIVLSRPSLLGKSKALTQFEFASSSKLLTRALLTGPTSKLEWNFVYGAPLKGLAYSPPAGAKLVKALTERPKIKVSDPRARNVVDQALRAYARIDSIAFAVSGSMGSSNDWMSGGSFRETRYGFDWSYHKGVLTIRDGARGRSYRGRCKPAGVVTYLKALKRPMEPVLQGLLVHQNPISKWFTQGSTVVSRGVVKLGGVDADAVEIKSNSLEVSLLIRRDNYLVTSVSSRIKDSGKTVSEAQREFTFYGVNKPIPRSQFFIPVTKPQPLPKIKK
jgi:hypothetical protein